VLHVLLWLCNESIMWVTKMHEWTWTWTLMSNKYKKICNKKIVKCKNTFAEMISGLKSHGKYIITCSCINPNIYFIGASCSTKVIECELFYLNSTLVVLSCKTSIYYASCTLHFMKAHHCDWIDNVFKKTEFILKFLFKDFKDLEENAVFCSSVAFHILLQCCILV